MKNIKISLLMLLTTASAFAEEGKVVKVTQIDPLVVKYDSNGNGKIDISERKGYVRERALMRYQERKIIATNRPKLTRQEREFYRKKKWDKETFKKYDVNKNGRLDVEERIQAMHNAAAEARTQFRKYDKNQDGKLDKAERESFKADISHRVSEGAKKKSSQE